MDQPQLGQLLGENFHLRDAVHVAIAPVTADEDLTPGEHVGLVGGTTVSALVGEKIGIVDPFLENTVRKGQRFYLWLYPGTITSLRHVWSHPAFTRAAEVVRGKMP